MNRTRDQVGWITLICSVILTTLIYALSYAYSDGGIFAKQRNLYLLGLAAVLPTIWLALRFAPSTFAFPSPRRTNLLGLIYSVLLIFFLKYQKGFLHTDFVWGLLGIGVLMAMGPIVSIFFYGKAARWIARFSLLVAASAAVFETYVLIRTYTYGFTVRPGTMSLAGYLVDANAAFHSITQAHLGKVALVDYFSLYGYFSLFFKPLAFIPLSAERIALLMSSLSLLALFLLYRALGKFIKNRCLQCVVISIVTYYLFSIHQATYWANLPIRFLFPALGFFLAVNYFETRNRNWFWAMNLSCALAPLWNLDTGVPVFLSGGFALIYDLWFKSSGSKTLCKKLITQIVILILPLAFFLTTFSFYAYLVRGQLPNFWEVFRFQKLYLDEGIVSLKMDAFDTWMILPLTYLTGLVFCGVTLKGGVEQRATAATVCFLSFLGLGLFAYYIMRSHIFCLFSVAWPALSLISLFAANALGSNNRRSQVWFGIPSIVLLTAFSLNPLATSVGLAKVDSEVLPGMATLREQRKFVSALPYHEKQLLILSDKSSFFYLDLRATSPVIGPGPSELVLAKDREEIEQAISHVDVLLDLDWYDYSLDRSLGIRAKLKHLIPKNKSPDGRLILFSSP